MAYAYNTHTAFEDKLRQIKYLKSLEAEAASNLNHTFKPGAGPGTEIVTRMFTLEHRQLTKKIAPLPKCSLQMLEDRKRGPFIEGGIFLASSS